MIIPLPSIQPNSNRAKEVTTLLFGLMTLISCDHQPRVATSFRADLLQSPKLLSDKITTNLSGGITIEGILPTLKQVNGWQTIEGARLRLMNTATGQLAYDHRFRDTGNTAAQKWIISESLPEGKYRLQVTTYDNREFESEPTLGELTIDRTAPSVTLYLGSEKSLNACENAPGVRAKVATRLVPFDFCAKDVGNAPSGVTGFCMVNQSHNGIPPLVDDPCWKKPEDILPLALLMNGQNTVRAFVKDAAGNVGKAESTIQLNIGTPPSLEILLPTTAAIAKDRWNPGETRLIRWKVTSPVSSFKNIKTIVSVVSATDHTIFRHLGCNFSNSPLWRQCPSKEIENSPHLQPGTASDTGEMTVHLPANWDLSQKFIVLISAIDEAGNAAVTSTPEFNAGYEVLAGQTYTGLGGSGNTLARMGYVDGKSYIATDSKGQLYDTVRSFKLNAFDSRTCRTFKGINSPSTAFDCDNIIETDYVLKPYWSYNRAKDLFYAQSGDFIVEINFNTRSVTPIFGGAGKTELKGEPLPRGAEARDYKSSTLFAYLYFDEKNHLLFIRTSGQLYAIDSTNNELRYILGKAGPGENYPPNSVAVKQRDILLPPEEMAFAVTSDGRMIFNGPRRPGEATGGERYLQYIVEDFSLTDPEARANLFLIPTALYLQSVVFDSDQNRFLASLAWHGFFKMDLPPKGSFADSYQWTPLVARGTTLEQDYLGNQNPSATPVTFQIESGPIAYPGAGILYMVNNITNSLLTLDFARNTVEQVVGFPTGSEASGLAMNRRLDTPFSLFLDPSGHVVFNDYYNLQRINLASNQNPEIETLKKDFDRRPMVFDPTNSTILQATNHGGELNTYSYPALVMQTHVGDRPGNVSYEIQYGIGNDYSRPKIFTRGSTWDPVRTMIFWSASWINDITSRSYQYLTGTASDAYSLGVPYCQDPQGNQMGCAQTTRVGNYYEGQTFRLSPRWGSTGWRTNLTLAAFDETDENVFTCHNGEFVKQSIASKKVFPYVAVTSTGPLQDCPDTGAVFKYRAGKIYFSSGNGIYEIDTSQIESTDRGATLTLVPTTAPLLSGVYRDFVIGDGFVYYTIQNRVLRNERRR